MNNDDPLELEAGGETDNDEEEEIFVSASPVNFEGAPRRLFAEDGIHESVSSHISSSHVSLGDDDLVSIHSCHSLTSHQSSEDFPEDPLNPSTIINKRQTRKNLKNKMYCKLARRYIWYHPWTRAARKRYRRVPTRYKYWCFLLWVSWKFIAAFLVVYFVSNTNNSDENSGTGGLRVLYMVTASNTILAQQPLYAETWIESATNLNKNNRYHVDVAFITGNETIDPNLVISWRQKLPASVNLFIWTDAIPWRLKDDKVAAQTDALWLQHRFVMKDRWPFYDIFMSWDADARVTVAHVDYFWQQSQKMADHLVILGFVPVSLAPRNQTKMTGETGPFDSRVCVGAPEVSMVVQDHTLLSLEAPTRHSGENSKLALIPSNDPRQGWMMTNQQVGSLLEECPYFLPSTDYHPAGCSWPRWVDLDPKQYSYHFVQHSANDATSLLSPNRLWKELGESDSRIVKH
eukprot:scaffold804_cov165-Amphora_coffeaeformis.AAC.11